MKKITLLSSLALAALLISGTIDLNNLLNYSTQPMPDYIIKNNEPANNRTMDAGATLGRVLFYDKKLSINNTIACASCHHQEFAFGDTALQSVGYDGGLTGRHSMRLANARFGNEVRFFWDERATSLENQTTQPIRDHVEMGFSGVSGNPGFDSLIRKLEATSYYPVLFEAAFGTSQITEMRIQRALSQFVRSIQSFDSKYDIGRAQVANDNQPFPNFTPQENMGKNLFLAPPPGGAGCQGCHRAPEFDIDPASRNNGVIGVIGDTSIVDLTNTRSPSLRNLTRPDGSVNGPMMHNGIFRTLNQVIAHYAAIPDNPNNTNLDPRLRGPGGVPQTLNLNQAQRDALAAFLRTLSGNAVYTDVRWSNPFDSAGNITLIPVAPPVSARTVSDDGIRIRTYPNPFVHVLNIDAPMSVSEIRIFDATGKLVVSSPVRESMQLETTAWKNGVYHIQLLKNNGELVAYRKVVKQ
jgi:cytochrome c peroxidase